MLSLEPLVSGGASDLGPSKRNKITKATSSPTQLDTPPRPEISLRPGKSLEDGTPPSPSPVTKQLSSRQRFLRGLKRIIKKPSWHNLRSVKSVNAMYLQARQAMHSVHTAA